MEGERYLNIFDKKVFQSRRDERIIEKNKTKKYNPKGVLVL